MASDPLNAEFARLLAASGWTQSEAARQLHLTPAAVSRYLSGETRPSETVLRLFRLLLGEGADLPRAAHGTASRVRRPPPASWEEDMLAALRRLEPARRQKVAAALRRLLAALE